MAVWLHKTIYVVVDYSNYKPHAGITYTSLNYLKSQLLYISILMKQRASHAHTGIYMQSLNGMRIPHNLDNGNIYATAIHVAVTHLSGMHESLVQQRSSSVFC